ncbi:4Fe-4S dicluster domain-containing protein [Natrialbaceae archaeon AArc-T1-2]|uniref:4Fe-4S dicluster domain-containing protein n=1 Tax=Natrialbaceae archaeon AArc-T1-2 TaxID=3053904 RepID=UPI00255AD07C|nr:4Fe-4S dicluster domain-containing protein [Natrialbaceae archaeon AArc-T1-2]WIV66675.1 4Fe-4S dicluster domain-containing protein [Natrialbaceae archaeon AArc-T1-2]
MSTQDDRTARVIPNWESCIDCGACEVACQRTWDLPPESDRIQVVALAHGDRENEANKPMQCYNCRDAPCIDVCPTEALHYSESGTVRVDAGRCIGCHYCGVGCPFGAPQYPDGEVPEAEESQPLGAKSDGLMDKCTTCEPRQEAGLEPACSSECPTDALLFGTPEDLSERLEEDDTVQPFDEEAAEIIFGDDADMIVGGD